jgi:hypothetical protein
MIEIAVVPVVARGPERPGDHESLMRFVPSKISTPLIVFGNAPANRDASRGLQPLARARTKACALDSDRL